MEKKGEISFTPLSDGLGFHPFADGLPYAPVTPSRTPRPNYSQGSGAVAAGPAMPVTSRISVPVATPRIQTRVSAELEQLAQAAPVVHAIEYGFGYLARRVIAYTLDSVVNLGLGFGAIAIVLNQQGMSLLAALTPGIALITLILAGTANWALILTQELSAGTTFGKRLLGLKVDGDAATIFLRAFFFVPSALFCGLGLAWSMFDRQRRCWHDVVVDLQPSEI